MGMRQAVTHSRLRRQMHDHLGLHLMPNFLHPRPVPKVRLQKPKLLALL